MRCTNRQTHNVGLAILLALLLAGCIAERPHYAFRSRTLLYDSNYDAYVQGCYQGLMRAAYVSHAPIREVWVYADWARNECIDLANRHLEPPLRRAGHDT